MSGYDTNWLWELVDRGPGWDGHDAAAITADVVENVEAFLRMLMIHPDIIPQPDGAFSLEWSRDEESYITVLIYKTYYKAVTVRHGIRCWRINSIDSLLGDGDGVLEMIEDVIK